MSRVFVIFHCVQTFFWLVSGEVTGWCSRNLVLSLKLPSSTWVGPLVPTEGLKDILLCIFLKEEPGLCPIPALLFLDCPSFVPALPPLNGHQTSLVVQWLRIYPPMQGTQVQALVQEDPTCHWATKPVHHNYWVHVPQLLKPMCLEPMLCNKRSHPNDKPTHHNKE